MIIITGTGRSGTSLAARFCEKIGFPPGGGWGRGIQAGREHPAIVKINNAFAGVDSEDRIPEDLRSRIRGFHRKVVKDPRFVTIENPLLLKTWQGERSDLRFIVMRRDLRAVASSFHANRQFFKKQHELSHGALVAAYQKKLDLFSQQINVLGLNVCWVDFPDCVDDYNLIHSAFVEFGGLKICRKKGRFSWEKLADKRKIHH